MHGTDAVLEIDGAHGEGGGQILRSAATLAALSCRAVRIVNVRAWRERPGLAPQHLTALRAAAALCDGELEGAERGSTDVTLRPRRPPRAGVYAFDVSEASERGSAGSASLVLQTVLPALALAAGASEVRVRGGTHVPSSPSGDDLALVWAPFLARLGFALEVELVRSGWYPAGGGELRARVAGSAGSAGSAPRALVADAPGELRALRGRALAASLPSHVAARMSARAGSLLAAAGLRAEVEARRERADSPGAATFLVAEHEEVLAGFCALGARGKPSERVAEEAVLALLAWHASGAALERHLADQLVLPLALAGGTSCFTVERVTRHLETVAWVVERFGRARGEVQGERGAAGRVCVQPYPERTGLPGATPGPSRP